MKKEEKKSEWEYKVEITDGILGCQTLLDSYGDKGWELVDMQISHDITFGGREAIIWVFKRQC